MEARGGHGGHGAQTTVSIEGDEPPAGFVGFENPDAGTLQHSEILRIAREMQEFHGTEDERRERFATKYPRFANGYPVLFLAAARPGWDVKELERMLGAMSGWKRDKGRADEAVGQMLFEKFVRR